MKRDEFNHIEVTNDKQIHGVEFGRTSANEYSFQRENVVNKNELNRQVKDELNEGAPDVTQKSHKQDGLTREEIEKLNTPSSASSSSSSASRAASTGASGAAASGGAATAAGSAAVSAGVVVVTAFTVVTATPIIVSNASAVLHHFESSENEIFYEIELVDTIETENYRVILTSESYQESKTLEPGINTGEFINLTANTEYELTVEEGNEIEIKRTLLKKNFTTSEEYIPISEIRGLYFDKNINFLERTFELKIDFIDELDIYSDFSFTLASDSVSQKYELVKTTEVQTFTIDPDFDLEDTYQYSFSYKENGVDVVYEENTFIFSDTSGAVSEFISGEVDASANFLTGAINVTLNYVDDFDILNDFKLVIYNDATGLENAKTYPLDKTKDAQSVNIKMRRAGSSTPVSSGLDLEEGPFTYFITYTRKGIEKETDKREINFIDNSGAVSIFNDGTVSSSADFLEETFDVTIDFTDDFGFLDNITLVIYDVELGEEKARSYVLSKELTAQTMSAKASGDLPALNLETSSFVYYFTYLRKGIANKTEPKEVKFDDYKGRQTVFKGIAINEADFYEQTFDVTLDFVDDFNRFSNFHIVLTDNTKSLTTEYDLDKETTTQTFSAESIEDSDMILDLEHSSLSYVLTYEERGVTRTVEGDTTFTDKNGLSSGVTTFDFTRDGDSKVLMNYATYAFDINMDFEDYFGYMSDFQLEFYRIIDEEKVAFDIEVDRAGGDQRLRVVDAMGFSAFCDGEAVNYELTYLNPNSVRETAKSGTIAFADSSVSEITDLEVGELKYDGACYYLPFRIDYIDEKSIFEHFSVFVENEDVPETYLIQLTDDGNTFMDNYWQLCYFSIGDISALTGKTATVTIKDSDTDEVLFSKNFDLVVDLLDGDMEVMGLRIAPLVSAEMPYFTIRYFANNGSVETDPVSIKFVNSYGTEYVFEGIWIPSAGGSINVDVDSEIYADFISNVNSNYTFDVYVIYPSAGGEDVEVLCYSAFKFDVS